MTWGMVGAAAITVVGSMVSANQSKQAAKGAMNAQTDAAQRGIDEQNTQLDAVSKLLSPYTSAGTSSLSAQQDILGTNGPEAQQKALDAIQNSSQFSTLAKQGENSILQNASATSGLRGGNTQATLAQFRPQLLSQLVDQQYSRLGGISQMGLTASQSQSTADMQAGTNISNLLGKLGAAQAGGALANGQANANATNGIFGGISKALGGLF